MGGLAQITMAEETSFALAKAGGKEPSVMVSMLFKDNKNKQINNSKDVIVCLNIMSKTETCLQWYMVETTGNVSSAFLKWEKLHFNIFENSCFHMKVDMSNF